MAAEPHHVVTRHFAEPFAVVADFGFLAVENFVNLGEIGLSVRIYLLARQWRPRFRLPGGIADHRRKIADQENCRVAHILKMLQLAQHHGVTQMNIRRRGIHAEIRAQRLSRLGRLLELRPKLALGNNFRRAFSQVRNLFVNGLEFRGCHLFFSDLFWLVP